MRVTPGAPHSPSHQNSSDLVVQDRSRKQHYSLAELTNKVVAGDALNILPKMPAESFDMVFVDPPYFLQLQGKKLKRWNVGTDVEGVAEDWDQFASFAEYDEFMGKLLTAVQRVMKPTATIWIIGTYHNIFRVGRLMQDLGYWTLNDVIWLKTNPMPNWLGVRFTNATETLIWALKDKEAKGYTFHKEYAKAFGVGKVGANVWVFPICAGKQRLKDANARKLHSAQKPVELLRRVILTSTKQGDLVLDPVAGTGTTGHVAQALGRDFTMIEVNPRYVEGIKRRFERRLSLSTEPSPDETSEPN